MRVSKGVKYGVVAGVVYGVVTLPASYYSFNILWPSVEVLLRQQGLVGEAIEVAYTTALATTVAGSLILPMVLPGALFGVIGALIWDRIRASWLAKGLILGVMVLVVEAAISFTSSALYKAPSVAGEVLEALALLGLITSVVASLAYGISFSILARRTSSS